MTREFFETRTLSEARGELYRNYRFKLPKVQTIGIRKALGRVVGREVISGVDLPGFSRSTMDGYAVRAEDTHGASEQSPMYLNLVGEIKMGRQPTKGLRPTETVKIATGGMLPEGADAVIMVEYTEEVGKQVEAVKAVAPGENVVQKGEDIKQGEPILNQGHVIRAQDIGALAGTGITRVPVFQKPKVAIISTGDEIVPADEEPSLGKIRDINSFSLTSAAEKDGAVPIGMGIVKDDFDTLKAKVEEALATTDLLILSGGSSVGTRDVTLDVIDAVGRPGVLVHGISLSPGKPTIIAVCQGKPIFGLSGHPGAALTVYGVLVSPFVKGLRGERRAPHTSVPRILKAKVGMNIVSTNGRTDFVRVHLTQKEDGLWAKPIYGSSGLIATLVRADGLICIPLEKNGLRQGEEVEVMLF
jgi:molybdopterin molybdotransferase